MNNPRRYVAVGVIGGLLYAVGGYDGSNVLDSVEVYDPKTDQWKYAASMKNRRRHVAVGVLTHNDLELPSVSNKTGKCLLNSLYSIISIISVCCASLFEGK